MSIVDKMTDAAVLAELGQRLSRHRLARNWTQAQTAARAGVGLATVQRAEHGESVQMTSMVKLLRTLELLEGLDAAIPESIDLPIAQLTRERRGTRQRARGDAREQPNPTPQGWTWGDAAQETADRQLPGGDDSHADRDPARVHSDRSSRLNDSSP